MSKTMPAVGEFCWNELATPNLGAAKEFYGKMFGWEFTDHDMGNTTYTMIRKGNKDFGGIWSIPTEQQNQIPPHWMTYILVDDLEGALVKAAKQGAKVIKEATKAGDMGRFGIIVDPTGAHIAFWQPNR